MPTQERLVPPGWEEVDTLPRGNYGTLPLVTLQPGQIIRKVATGKSSAGYLSRKYKKAGYFTYHVSRRTDQGVIYLYIWRDPE